MSDFETVKQRADIVDVIGGYVALARSGHNFKAPCPFHNERTPSFYVFPDRQTWRCFGACAAGGDVFTFIERKENVEPVEALRLLAERYGIELAHRTGRADETPLARLVEANEAAARFYHDLLRNAAGPAAGEARTYLERRGVNAAMRDAFQLGFAPDGHDLLRAHLASRGVTPAEMVEAGLIMENERGTFDRFRSRLMFPIRDERGRVIGFGGRVIGEGVPKYLNTPQTALFDKGATLYALDRARDAIRAVGVAVVVEGYLDALTAHQFGIENVVATLGTALTERHVALLKRYTRQVVLAMDADSAGIEAAMRGEEVVRRSASGPADADAEAAGRQERQAVVDWRGLVRTQAAAPLEIRVFTVPQGKDPDEAIRADAAGFRELTRLAVPPFEFRLHHELAGIDRGNPRARMALADRLLPLVAAVADRAVQAQYLARLAQAVGVPEAVLAARMAAGPEPSAGGTGHRAVRRDTAPMPLREPVMRGGPAGGHPEAATEPAAAIGDRSTPSPSAAEPGAALERFALRLLLGFGALREQGLSFDETLLTAPDLRALFVAWRTHGAAGLDSTLDDTGRALLSRVLALRLPGEMDDATAARAFEDVVRRLEKRRLQDQARLLAVTLREAEDDAGAPLRGQTLDALAAGQPAVDGETAQGPARELAARLAQTLEVARDLHRLETALRQHEPSPRTAPPVDRR